MLVARLLCLTLLSVAALAGCMGPQSVPEGSEGSRTPDGTGQAPRVPPAAQPTVTAELGALTGRVMNDELVPIEGASIVLGTSASGLRTHTDADGRFTMNDLEPGKYSLHASALGYEPRGELVPIAAGETFNISLLLNSLVINSARNSTFIGDGYIDFAWSIPGFYGYNETKANKQEFFYALDPDVMTVIAAAKWQAGSAATAKYMQMWMYVGSKTCVGARSHCAVGPSPVQSRWDTIQEQVQAKVNQRVGLGLTPNSCDPAVCTTQPDTWAQVASQQRFTFYTSIFYAEPAPQGYSPLPPS